MRVGMRFFRGFLGIHFLRVARFPRVRVIIDIEDRTLSIICPPYGADGWTDGRLYGWMESTIRAECQKMMYFLSANPALHFISRELFYAYTNIFGYSKSVITRDQIPFCARERTNLPADEAEKKKSRREVNRGEDEFFSPGD